MGGTNLSAGLDQAISIFQGAIPDLYRTRVIILLTDGQWNDGRDPQLAANDARNAGITVHTRQHADIVPRRSFQVSPIQRVVVTTSPTTILSCETPSGNSQGLFSDSDRVVPAPFRVQQYWCDSADWQEYGASHETNDSTYSTVGFLRFAAEERSLWNSL